LGSHPHFSNAIPNPVEFYKKLILEGENQLGDGPGGLSGRDFMDNFNILPFFLHSCVPFCLVKDLKYN